MGVARKYILQVNKLYPSGTTYVNNIVYYNLTNSFSGITDNGIIYNFNYSGITTTQLSQLPISDYNKRVFDFLCYVNVDNLVDRTNLINTSTYNEVACDGTTTTTTSTTTTLAPTTTTTSTTTSTTTLAPTTTTSTTTSTTTLAPTTTTSTTTTLAPTTTTSTTTTTTPVYTWTKENSATVDHLQHVQFTSANTVWSCGYKSSAIPRPTIVIKSSDAGVTWNAVTSLPQTDSDNINRCFNSFYFINSNVGWFCGLGIYIYSTIDGGSTWVTNNNPISSIMNSIFALSTTNVWACGQLGIIHTTDGSNWNSQYTSATTLLGIYFTDSIDGWVCGYNGTILHTANGGTNWNTQTTGTINNLSSIYFTNLYNGWACGNNGTILHTTTSGTIWTSQTSNTTADLKSITFVDINNGWACGTDETVVYTTNGGITWTNQQTSLIPTTESLLGISMFSTSLGWTCGTNGIIYKLS